MVLIIRRFTFEWYLNLIIAGLLVYPIQFRLIKNIHKSITLIFCSLFILSILIQFGYINTLIDTLDIFICLNHEMYFIAVIAVWLQKEKIMLQLIDDVDKNLFEYTNKFMQKIHSANIDKEKLKHSFVTCLIVTYTPFVTVLLGPSIMNFYLRDDNNSNSVQDYTKYLLCPSWHPYSLENVTTFYLTYIYQLIITFPTCLCMTSTLVTCFYLMQAFQMQIKSLTTVLSIIENYAYNRIDYLYPIITEDNNYYYGELLICNQEYKNWKNVFENLIICQFKECIRHHQSIIRFSKNFISCYKWILLIGSWYCSYMITIQVFMIFADEFYWPKVLVRLSILLTCVAYLGFFCYIGENFRKVNMEFKKAVYGLRWYQHSKPIKNLVLLIQSITYWDIEIKISREYVLSYVLYGTVLKNCYTFTSFLFKMTQEE